MRFAERLPALRAAMAEHMEQKPLSFEWTAALAVRLINAGWFRVGDERYARSYKTFGITTLRKSHVRVRGSRVSFRSARSTASSAGPCSSTPSSRPR